MPETLGQIVFEWPWVGLLLPLPWVVRALTPRAERAEGQALWVPTLDDYAGLGGERRSRSRWRHLLAALIWVLALVAGMRPVWLGEPIALPMSGRDLMLAVDLSKSMQQVDFQLRGQIVDRLTAAKAVARQFIAARDGDRVGLIVFADQAYLQTPLTLDRKTVITLLDETVIGLAGKRTAIGDAIGLAVKRLADPGTGQIAVDNDRVLILMTDGANTAGEVEPLVAAELAADAGLKIHTIGMGADEQVVRTVFGQSRVNPSLDLDEETLTQIAEITGGRYFRAKNTGELAGIYAEIDRMEPVVGDPDYFRPRREYYLWPLGAALLAAGLTGLGTGLRRLRRAGRTTSRAGGPGAFGTTDTTGRNHSTGRTGTPGSGTSGGHPA